MNHVCKSLNHARWECKYHVVIIRRGMNLAGRHNLWYCLQPRYDQRHRPHWHRGQEH